MTPLLEVNQLNVELRTRHSRVTALNSLSLRLYPGETLAVVGESGCGKSLTALALMGLLPSPVASVTGGEILFAGQNLVNLREREWQRLRGRRISMIFQDPMSSLNPVKTVGQQLTEVLRLHLGLGRQAAWDRAVELLKRVHIPDPMRRMREYPHRLSGGMSQRVMIAMAIACEPVLLIADEPTTALDVTIQAQILALLRELQQQSGMALMLITHDLGVVAAMAQRVAVMYAGRKVEEAPLLPLFDQPQHPYTQGLLRATPTSGRPGERLTDIAGRVPQLAELPAGCAFYDRCPLAQPQCRQQQPALVSLYPQHIAACFVAQQQAQPLARVAGAGGY
ncbi:oligopeptide/dipeptide ABC transporter ATP-binding protein [Erwinia toletana]|uniref:ABC-type dipeptide transporter n=1 Tax=Winslowiella toletana TaxID=92490 RepID=A0ABS4PFM8_9GAMM|nr:ABC transporter ATP-binding protein [Winslowiella toletana]MBP2171454.1 oligopeptide/dipeptide ABC transporter ATP-binding protein [Winslowiella toletana]